MAANILRFLCVLVAAVGISGCMLCDRYCERQQDRCRSFCQPSCTPNFCPPTSHYPQPVYPQPAGTPQPPNYCN